MTTVLTAPGPRADVPLGTRLVAVVACAAIGLRTDLFKGLTPGVLVMVLTAPLWWPQLRSSRVVAWLVGLTVLTIGAGYTMAWAARLQRDVDWRYASSTASTVALTFAGIVVLLWARTVISTSATVAAFVVGVVLFTLSTPRVWADDPWKFGFARPVTVLALLAVAWAARRDGRARPWLTVSVLAVLAVVSTVFDYRSESGFLVLVIVLVVWQAVAVGGRRRLRALSPALLLVTVAGAVYLGATQLFVSGALGTAIQERSSRQIDASGSLLLGGRPEWSATVELMGHRANGYGFGVLADSVDLQLALDGFASIHADPATGYENYITYYMLAGGFHLHSTAADLWAAAGIVGLLISAFTVGLVIWSLSASLAVGRAEPLLIYSSIVVLWDIAFSPLYSSVTEIVLGLLLAVVSLEHVRAARARTPGDPPPETAPAASDVGSGSLLHSAVAAVPERNGGRRGSV